jgi:tRNA pseudouridine13 synthase
MKLKQSPEDFFVEECTGVLPGESGPFALYRLEKRGWTTPDAVLSIRSRWQIPGDRIAYGGLKDRHAHTLQHLTILSGPRRGLSETGYTLQYLGQMGRPFEAADIAFNRFRLTLRDLDAGELARASTALAELRRDGVPNYFDDQRFGSVNPGGEFVARLLVRGRYEDALRLALAGPYEHDRAAARREKETLRRHWGNWATCKDALPKGHARSLVDYLVHHPDDFRGAIARLRPELSGLYLSAWQSHLWNGTLAHWLRERCPPECLRELRLKLGPMPVPVDPPAELRPVLDSLEIPLASARLEWEEAASWAGPLRAVLAEAGVELGELKLKGLRRPFFARGMRAAWLRPANLTFLDAADDRHPGRRLLRLAFELPRGCYATMIVKRITDAAA